MAHNPAFDPFIKYYEVVPGRPFILDRYHDALVLYTPPDGQGGEIFRGSVLYLPTPRSATGYFGGEAVSPSYVASTSKIVTDRVSIVIGVDPECKVTLDFTIPPPAWAGAPPHTITFTVPDAMIFVFTRTVTMYKPVAGSQEAHYMISLTRRRARRAFPEP